MLKQKKVARLTELSWETDSQWCSQPQLVATKQGISVEGCVGDAHSHATLLAAPCPRLQAALIGRACKPPGTSLPHAAQHVGLQPLSDCMVAVCMLECSLV